jgi:hypothetical protein
VFKYITAGNNLKPFRVRIAYANTNISIGGQRTITLLGRNKTNNDEIDQAKNKAATLKAKEEVKVERE